MNAQIAVNGVVVRQTHAGRSTHPVGVALGMIFLTAAVLLFAPAVQAGRSCEAQKTVTAQVIERGMKMAEQTAAALDAEHARSGAQVVVLAGSRSQPVTEEQARPAIEQYLLNERKRKLVEDDIKAMRTAAKIEYFGKFAEGPRPGSASSPAASAGAEAASAPELAPADISKGMGLK